MQFRIPGSWGSTELFTRCPRSCGCVIMRSVSLIRTSSVRVDMFSSRRPAGVQFPAIGMLDLADFTDGVGQFNNLRMSIAPVITRCIRGGLLRMMRSTCSRSTSSSLREFSAHLESSYRTCRLPFFH